MPTTDNQEDRPAEVAGQGRLGDPDLIAKAGEIHRRREAEAWFIER